MATSPNGLGRRIASRLYHLPRTYWRPLPTDLDALLEKRFARLGPSATLVQIGANDLISGDPLHHHIKRLGLFAVLAEPPPALFEQLTANFAYAPNVTCVNCVVAREPGHLPFYVVAGVGTRYPAFFSQISSFDRATIEKQRRDYPTILDDILEVSVEMKMVDQLLATAGFTHAAGHDAGDQLRNGNLVGSLARRE